MYKPTLGAADAPVLPGWTLVGYDDASWHYAPSALAGLGLFGFIKKIAKPVVGVAVNLIPGGGVVRSAVQTGITAASAAFRRGATEEAVSRLSPEDRAALEREYLRSRAGDLQKWILPAAAVGAVLLLARR